MIATSTSLFYFFAALMLSASLFVITTKNPVRAVLSLIVTFMGAAGLWLLLEAEFLAITLVLVYVGAVMVLFLFVVMMLDIKIAALKEGFTPYFFIGITAAATAVFIILQFLDVSRFGSAMFAEPILQGENYHNTELLGLAIYTDYLLPFATAGILLLAAIVAAVSLTFRGKRARKGQSAHEQSQVTKAQRLKIISLPVTPKEKV